MFDWVLNMSCLFYSIETKKDNLDKIWGKA